MTKEKEISRRVGDIYKWLDDQLRQKPTAGVCSICGRCCDFDTYDHRLYVTTPELVYFVEKVSRANIKQMVGGRCSYQVDGKCGVHAYRFSGCRIFCCKGDAGFQSELTEAVIKKFKALCLEMRIPYRYVDLPTALKEASGLCGEMHY